MEGRNEIIQTQDGSHTIFSNKYGVSYHSKYGAVQESRHVFIEAGLFHKALVNKEIRILEIGFGTGLNAFLTLLESEQHHLRIWYTAIEAYPLDPEIADLLNYPAQIAGPEEEKFFQQLHRCPWGDYIEIKPFFHFRKVCQRIEEISYHEEFDLVYFDAFAPDAQPELWEIPVLSKMYDSLKSKGVLVTYCAKGVVKRRFRELGFEVESLPGPPGKREMTRCVKP